MSNAGQVLTGKVNLGYVAPGVMGFGVPDAPLYVQNPPTATFDPRPGMTCAQWSTMTPAEKFNAVQSSLPPVAGLGSVAAQAVQISNLVSQYDQECRRGASVVGVGRLRGLISIGSVGFGDPPRRTIMAVAPYAATYLRAAGQALPTGLTAEQNTQVQAYCSAQLTAASTANAATLAARDKTIKNWKLGTAGAGAVAVLALVYAIAK